MGHRRPPPAPRGCRLRSPASPVMHAARTKRPPPTELGWRCEAINHPGTRSDPGGPFEAANPRRNAARGGGRRRWSTPSLPAGADPRAAWRLTGICLRGSPRRSGGDIALVEDRGRGSPARSRRHVLPACYHRAPIVLPPCPCAEPDGAYVSEALRGLSLDSSVFPNTRARGRFSGPKEAARRVDPCVAGKSDRWPDSFLATTHE